MRNKIFLIFMLGLPFTALQAHERAKTYDDRVKAALNSHYSAYKDEEYFSGITLSIYTPKQGSKDYYIGQVGHEESSKPIDANTLFEIGSITKSFTAALVLQLEKEKLLHLKDKIQKWLPQYNKWSQLSIQSLLNMTSGLPNYSDSPLMNTEIFKHPEKLRTEQELIQFVYPAEPFSPPLRTGYFYSNTGYILTAMIIEKISQQNFQTVIENRLLKPAGLENTFYPIPQFEQAQYDRLAHGYNYNPYANPELLGQDMKPSNLSWAGAAGALISNSSDIVKWVKALFIESKILDSQQKKQLTQLISTETGKALAKTSTQEPRAFGLGVIQGFDKNMGQYWFYEGQTEGFRALYLYVPSSGIIISCIFNSAVDSENDHAGELMKKIYSLTKEAPRVKA